LTPSRNLSHLKVENRNKWKKIDWIFHFQMPKLFCEVFLINNFQWQSYSCVFLEDSEKIASKSIHITFYNDSSAPSSIEPNTYVSNGCISKTAASICMCDTPLKKVLHCLSRDDFILGSKAQLAPSERVLLPFVLENNKRQH